MSATKPPDFTVSAMLTAQERIARPELRNTKIGVAWQQADGSISVKLEPFVVLSGNERPMIRLWPVNRAAPPTRPSSSTSSEFDDDIPF